MDFGTYEPTKGCRSRDYTFTVHNFTEDAERLLQEDFCNSQYLIYGYEVGDETERPHLQCYVYFTNARTWKGVYRELSILGDVRLYVSKGDSNQNFDYCNKEGQFFIHGVRPKSQKEKGELNANRFVLAEAAALSGDLSAIPRDIYVRYYNVWQKIYAGRPRPVPDLITELRPWQQELKQYLEGPVDPRKILWYHDAVGNTGKSVMSDYIVHRMGGCKAFMCKSSDAAYALPDDPKIVVFDLTRSMEGFLNYSLLEAIKNGCVFSPKYESRVKYFARPHVVVFSNFLPDHNSLSLDRWQIIELKNA